MKHGADINAIAGDGPGAPLRLAQRGQHQEIIALLLARGAETMLATTPATSSMANAEAPPLHPDEAPAILPDNKIEFTRSEPDETGDIEEISLTSGYGVDTNLLTLDLLRLSEAEDAAALRSEAASKETAARNEQSGFWKRRGYN